MNKKIMLPFLMLILMMILSCSSANASTYGSLANKKVITTKSVKVFKVYEGSSEATNKFYYNGKISKGTHLKVSGYYMSTGGYIVKNSKYNSHGNMFYIVASDNDGWFKKDIHKHKKTYSKPDAKLHIYSKFNRTNNKAKLKASGFKLDNSYKPNPTIYSKYYPNNSKAYIPKKLKIVNPKGGTLSWVTKNKVIYSYSGHNKWECDSFTEYEK